MQNTRASSRSHWLKPTSHFSPAPDLPIPSGGTSPEKQLFRKASNNSVWFGKCAFAAMLREEVVRANQRPDAPFISCYLDEIREILGLSIYKQLGVLVPKAVLSYLPLTEENQQAYDCHSPRMHIVTKFINEDHPLGAWRPLGSDFVATYIAQAKASGAEYVKYRILNEREEEEDLPLQGLGNMLAAANFLRDLDCIGNSGGNVGYVIREREGERYAQVVKIDAGYAFSYYGHFNHLQDDPRDKKFETNPNHGWLAFADLSKADQKEFAATAKHILSIPREVFTHVFDQAQGLEEGIPAEHCRGLLDGLIKRKELFLAAYAGETEDNLVAEIEAARAAVARELGEKELDVETTRELLSQQQEELRAQEALRVQLAVFDSLHGRRADQSAGSCKSFRLPTCSQAFVGRTEALEAVSQELNQNHGTVIGQSISGLGGVGKTQLALQYAHAAVEGRTVGGQRLNYDYVMWLNAETYLEGQFQAMAEVWLGTQELSGPEAVEAIYQRLLAGKRSLIVFDNAENAKSLAPYLPRADFKSPLHLLITSRCAQWGGISVVQLGGFSKEEAQHYVELHLGKQKPEEVEALREAVGGLPLALSQAVAYIKAEDCSIREFIEQYELNKASLLSQETFTGGDAQVRSVGTTLSLSLAQARVRNDLSEQLLGVMGYLSAQGIRLELLEKAMEEPRDAVKEGLRALAEYSLVEYEIEKGEVEVHRLVQEVMRQRQAQRRNRYESWDRVVEALSQVVVNDKKDLERTRSSSYAIEHVKQLVDLWRRERSRSRKDSSREKEGEEKQNGLSREQELALSNLLERSGLHQETMGNYEVARELQSQVLEIRETHYGPEHVEVARTLGSLGNAYGDLGDVWKQKELLERALRIFEAHYGPDDVAVAITLGNLGNVHGALGNALKKRELLERTLRIFEAHYGPDHVAVAIPLTNLGNAHGALGDALKKKELLERALRIFEAHYGPDHVAVAIPLTALGNAHGALGDAGKARELLERALRIKETHYGPDHVEVARTLTSLGHVYGDLGDSDTAKEPLERALHIKEAHYGPDHVEVAITLTNLGIAYGALGDAGKAKELLERALRIKEAHYGPHHVEVAIPLTNLGIAYGAVGDALKQKKLLEHALRILEPHYGHDHVVVGITLISLSVAYECLGDFHKQKELLERALRIQETHYGLDHVQVAITLYNLARAYLSLEEVAMAIDCAQRVVEIRKLHFDEIHPVMQRAPDLLKYCMAKKDAVKGSASESPKAPHVAGQRQEEEKLAARILGEEEQFVASVEWGVGDVEEATRGRGDESYESNSTASFVGTALQVLKRGRWQQLEQAPEDYGIAAELLEDLQEYREANEEVLKQARTYEELAKRRTLLRGGRLEVRAGMVEQEKEEGEKEVNPKPSTKEDDSKRCVVS